MRLTRCISFTIILFAFLMSIPGGSMVIAQEKDKPSAGLPDNIYKIVSVSCMPCHSSSGGLLSRTHVNFDEWTTYSAEKQQKKAAKMVKEVNKGAMPPKEARENNPAIIPTKDQIEVIKKWADSLKKGK